MTSVNEPLPDGRVRLLSAAATAVLWWLAQQQWGFFALGWIALVPLLWCAGQISSGRSRFFFGWSAGWLCFALHNWWLIPTLTKSSVVIGVPPAGGFVFGVLAVVLIAAGHGMGVAVISLFWIPRAPLFARAPLLLPLLIGLLWFVFDWARSEGELAHSWGSLAFSQWRDPALLQSTVVLGQHGLSALCAAFAASLALWLRSENSARVPNLWRIPVAIFALLHGWGAWRIYVYDNAAHETMRVLLVQTNVPSLRKNIGSGETHFQQAERLTREYFRLSQNGESPALVVWPETTFSATEVADSNGTYRWSEQSQQAQNLVRDIGSSLLAGVQIRLMEVQAEAAPTLFNRALLMTPGQPDQQYTKARLVPFGERAPFTNYFAGLSRLAPTPPIAPRTEPEPEVLRTRKYGKIGALICFESSLISPARGLKAQGARVLFVLTNNEWFTGSNAPWEHAAMSVIRAVENDLPVAQAANGGYSLAVDARGRILAQSNFGSEQLLLCDLPLTTGEPAQSEERH